MLSDPTFWVLVAFVLFLGLLWYLKVPGAVTKLLDDRAEKIGSDLDKAAKLREDAQALFADYQKKQRDALKEAEAIVAAARGEAERLSAQAAADLEASLKRREQLALQRIAQAEQQATADVRAAAVDLAMAATRKLLTEKIDRAGHEALIEGAIKELPGKLN
jgi:F-type H+-transporting ATPase subunit b